MCWLSEFSELIRSPVRLAAVLHHAFEIPEYFFLCLSLSLDLLVPFLAELQGLGCLLLVKRLRVHRLA